MKKILEGIRRDNMDKGIYPSYNKLIESLFERDAEMREVYEELNTKLTTNGNAP